MLEKADLKRDKSVVCNMIRKDTQAKSCCVSPKHSESVNAADNFANEQLINNRSQNIITRNDENTKITFDVSGNLKDTSYLASTIYKRNVDGFDKPGTGNNESILMAQSKSQNDSNKFSKRVLISKQKDEDTPEVIYNNLNNLSHDVEEKEHASDIQLELVKNQTQQYVKKRNRIRDSLSYPVLEINSKILESKDKSHSKSKSGEKSKSTRNNEKKTHMNSSGKIKKAKNKSKEKIEDARMSSIRESGFNPIVEVVGESSKSQFHFKKASIRESGDTNKFSYKIDSDTVKYEDHKKKDKAEISENINTKHDHHEYQTDEDDEEEKVHMQPYSYRSKITERNTKVKKIKKNNKVVERLYTIKTSNMFSKTQAFKDEINVEDHTPNTKYNKFLDKTLIAPNSQTNFNGNKTVVLHHAAIFSPFRVKVGRHRHSNSETIVKTQSFKSNHNSQKFSKNGKKILTPDNPSLIIFQSKLEEPGLKTK